MSEDLTRAVDQVIDAARAGLLPGNSSGLVSFYSKRGRRIIVVVAVGDHERRLTDLLDDPEVWA